MGGFECSTHRDARGRRHDLIAATRHDEFALADYTRLMDFGMLTARDGVRWHLIEREPGRYDFSSLAKQAKAVRETGIQIIWDYFHYGYPDHLNIFSRDFVRRFADFSREVTKYLLAETGGNFLVCPMNELSFFAWIAGDRAGFYPSKTRRANELKRNLVRAMIASIDAIREVYPGVRFVATDPAIHVHPPKNASASARRAAERHRLAQFEVFDMLCGRLQPELGGGDKYLDILGINYYVYNQWRKPSGRKIMPGHAEYRPFSLILQEYGRRYERPMFIAETGIEDEARPWWYSYVRGQAEIAAGMGAPVEGLCLYPIFNHPGWSDDRHCHNGLWDYPDDDGVREIYQPLADEIQKYRI